MEKALPIPLILIVVFSTATAVRGNASTAGDNTPETRFGGLVQINDVKGSKNVQELGMLAVETFNKNFHGLNGASGPLKFEAVIAAEKQVVNGIKYRLKINAKDKGGDIKTFDADIVVKPNSQTKELIYFEPTNSAVAAAPAVAASTVPTTPELKPNFALGGLTEITDVTGNKEVQDLGNFSVDEYNKKFHSLDGVSSGKLTFEAVVAAKKQAVAGMKYYLTVQAKQDGATKTFDVEIYLNPSLQKKELMKFTPSAAGNGGENTMLGGKQEIEDVKGNKEIQEVGRFAVEEFNKHGHSLNGASAGRLEFVAVVSAEQQVVAGIMYSLKVQARADGVTKTYDVVVATKPGSKSMELRQFAPSSD